MYKCDVFKFQNGKILKTDDYICMPRKDSFLVSFSQIHRCVIIISAPSNSILGEKHWYKLLMKAAFNCIKYNQQMNKLMQERGFEEKRLYRYKYRIDIVQDLYKFISLKNDRNIPETSSE